MAPGLPKGREEDAFYYPHFQSIKSLLFVLNLEVVFLILNQANHRFTTTMQRRIYGHATDVAIRPLNEEKAVQAAADRSFSLI